MPTLDKYDCIQVLDYDPVWPETFEALATRVRAVLSGLVVRIEHVGSTAVPGLAAKPVVDLDVVVGSAGDMPLAIEGLALLGYVHAGNLGIEGREAFRWPAGEPRHHLYLLLEGARELRRHMAFRDALRTDARLRSEYADLKQSLARRYRSDIEAYSAGKDDFVEAVLNRHGA